MNERDTHFAGFAELLERELSEWQMQRIRNMQSGIIYSGEEDARQMQQIIARRAYDLMEHIMLYAPVSPVPDMTEWPED